MEIPKLFSWWFRLLNIRTEGKNEDIVARRIAFSNIIYISLPLVYLVFILIDIKAYLNSFDLQAFDQYIVPVEIVVCLFCFWLNRIQKSRISRVVFIISWLLLMHILPLYLLESPSDYFLAYPLGIIFHSLLIQLMFSFRKETWFFWTLISFNFVLMLFCSQVLVFFSSPQNVIVQFKNDWYYFLDIVLYWLLFNMVMFYTLYVIEKYINGLNASNKQIQEQKEELAVLIENLDLTVANKTEKLENQNEKLREFAFYNAHIIRGPFCRIQGLMQLFDIMSDEELKRSDIKGRLQESIEELDTRIKEIQEIVKEDPSLQFRP